MMFFFSPALMRCFMVVAVLIVVGGPIMSIVEAATTDLLNVPQVGNSERSPVLHLERNLSTTRAMSLLRRKRSSEHHISDCIYMTLEEGEFYYKAIQSPDGKACGIYISSEPDQLIEIRFNYVNFPCENGGLVAVVDGWELNGQVFPSPQDHQKPLSSRFDEFCGHQKKLKKIFVSSQNAALIQYRVPRTGSSFTFTVKFVKTVNPCNILFQTDEVYTLRNYGKRSNCSVSFLFPALVRVVDLNVGVTPTSGRGIEVETGTIHKCQKRGLDDFVQIGGTSGLDNTNLKVVDSLCGLDSKPGRHSDLIGCDTTTARLVSSGAFENSVTVSFRQMTENDIDNHMSLVCLPDDVK